MSMARLGLNLRLQAFRCGQASEFMQDSGRRRLCFRPASLMASLKAALSFLEPWGRQLGREADSSRSLVQMKRWHSNSGIWIGF